MIVILQSFAESRCRFGQSVGRRLPLKRATRSWESKVGRYVGRWAGRSKGVFQAHVFIGEWMWGASVCS